MYVCICGGWIISCLQITLTHSSGTVVRCPRVAQSSTWAAIVFQCPSSWRTSRGLSRTSTAVSLSHPEALAFLILLNSLSKVRIILPSFLLFILYSFHLNDLYSQPLIMSCGTLCALIYDCCE